MYVEIIIENRAVFAARLKVEIADTLEVSGTELPQCVGLATLAHAGDEQGLTSRAVAPAL